MEPRRDEAYLPHPNPCHMQFKQQASSSSIAVKGHWALHSHRSPLGSPAPNQYGERVAPSLNPGPKVCERSKWQNSFTQFEAAQNIFQGSGSNISARVISQKRGFPAASRHSRGFGQVFRMCSAASEATICVPWPGSHLGSSRAFDRFQDGSGPIGVLAKRIKSILVGQACV